MEAFRESGYPSITDVPVGFVKKADKLLQRDIRSILQEFGLCSESEVCQQCTHQERQKI